jgi:hypothetical protein
MVFTVPTREWPCSLSCTIWIQHSQEEGGEAHTIYHRPAVQKGAQLLFTRHLTSATHKATGIFLQLFPLLARDSTLSIPNKITLYKLFICSVFTYAAPVWSNTSSSNYRRLQILQSKCLRVIGNYPRCTPIPRLHTALNVPPICDFIYHFTDNFFGSCPAHPNPLVSSIGNYTLADLHRQYKKYIHKWPKHLLL